MAKADNIEWARRTTDGDRPPAAEALRVAAEGVLLLDDEGTVLYANQSAAELLGEPQEALVGSSRPSLLSRDVTDIVVLTSAGDPRSLEASVRELSWKGTSLSVVSLHDVTHLRRMLIDLTAAVTDQRLKFAASAHELRSPLASIVWTSETLKNLLTAQADSGSLGDQLDLVVRQARYLAGLVRAILKASLVKPVNRGAAGLVDLASLLHSGVAERVGWSGSLHIDCPDGLTVRGDPTTIQLMVSNCVTNALRHGQPPVEVRCQPETSRVVIRIIDQGPGVPDNIVEQLFEPVETNFSEASILEGGGMGLPIVRYLALMTGGDCWYEGRRDEGTSFAIALPRTAADG